jgi:hypothetical protein
MAVRLNYFYSMAASNLNMQLQDGARYTHRFMPLLLHRSRPAQTALRSGSMQQLLQP